MLTRQNTSGIRKASTKKINTFFSSKVTSLDKNVKAAEATLAFHSVLHHHSYNSVDCTSKLGKVIYSDSQIANYVKCGKTKTEAIVNHFLATHALYLVTSTLRNEVQYFGNGTDALKLFPVVAQYFDDNEGIQVKLLEMDTCSNEGAEAVSWYICSTLDKHEITSKCIAFCGDNTNVNFGGVAHNPGRNIFSNLKQSVNEEIICVTVSCPHPP
jgi:hypothetical protein